MVGNSIENGAEVFQCLFMADRNEGGESVALARWIALVVQECCQEIGRIRHQFGKMREYGGDGKSGVLPNIGMSVCQTLADRFCEDY